MTVTFVEEHTGIFRRQQRTYRAPTSEERVAFRASCNEHIGIDPVLAGWEAQAIDLLTSLDYPVTWEALCSIRREDMPRTAYEAKLMVLYLIRVRRAIEEDAAKSAAYWMMKLQFTAHQVALEPFEPLVVRADKDLADKQRGQARAYGTPDEKAEKRAQYRATVARLHTQHPDWSWKQLRYAAATACDVAARTIRRYVRNPKTTVD